MTETLFKYIMESSAADHESSSLRLHQTFILINQGAVIDCYIVKNIIRFVFSMSHKITFSIFTTSAVCVHACSGTRLLRPSESLLSL